jgi:hypothetical protein
MGSAARVWQAIDLAHVDLSRGQQHLEQHRGTSPKYQSIPSRRLGRRRVVAVSVVQFILVPVMIALFLPSLMMTIIAIAAVSWIAGRDCQILDQRRRCHRAVQHQSAHRPMPAFARRTPKEPNTFSPLKSYPPKHELVLRGPILDQVLADSMSNDRNDQDVLESIA